MRRRGLHPVARALDGVTAQLAPATLLAEVQRAWPEAVGEALAAQSDPWSENAGTVRVACPQAVYAQEIDLMSELLVERLNAVLGRTAVTCLRAEARPCPLRDA